VAAYEGTGRVVAGKEVAGGKVAVSEGIGVAVAGWAVAGRAVAAPVGAFREEAEAWRPMQAVNRSKGRVTARRGKLFFIALTIYISKHFRQDQVYRILPFVVLYQ
jgi:hypothetical protein